MSVLGQLIDDQGTRSRDIQSLAQANAVRIAQPEDIEGIADQYRGLLRASADRASLSEIESQRRSLGIQADSRFGRFLSTTSRQGAKVAADTAMISISEGIRQFEASRQLGAAGRLNEASQLVDPSIDQGFGLSRLSNENTGVGLGGRTALIDLITKIGNVQLTGNELVSRELGQGSGFDVNNLINQVSNPIRPSFPSARFVNPDGSFGVSPNA